MLQLDNIRFRQGAFELSADLTVAKGRRTAIIGPSGAGKSTLLDLISGFQTPQVGRILVDGQDVTQSAPGDRPVAILFQDNNLFPHLTIGQNLTLAMRPKSGRAQSGDEERIDAALDQVGLAGFQKRRPEALSGGQRSRAALARVLLQDRPILLLDEPFSALGPALRQEMADLICSLTAPTGTTAIMVTHDVGDARRFAEDIILVDDGTVYPPKTAEDLLKNPPKALRDYIGT